MGVKTGPSPVDSVPRATVVAIAISCVGGAVIWGGVLYLML
jgi:hypothetical protein